MIKSVVNWLTFYRVLVYEIINVMQCELNVKESRHAHHILQGAYDLTAVMFSNILYE